MTLLLFVVGLALVIYGADLLIYGASRLALAFGLSPLVVGLTVVAFGTSAPELAVSVQAAWTGEVDVSTGNVVGSNIVNVLLILGVAAAIAPLIVSRMLILRDVPVMILAATLLWLQTRDGQIGFWDGALLFVLLLLYVVLLLKTGRQNDTEIDAEAPIDNRPAVWRHTGMVVGGVALMVLGADWLVQGAVALAHWLGVSELVVGLTIVAIGTSLPEAATSITASIRGQRDIAIGNIVGSNIFNVFTVLGLSAMVAPQGRGLPVAPDLQHVDIPVMVAISLLCLPLLFTGRLLSRWEGGLLVALYATYVAWLVLSHTGSSALPGFVTAVIWGVIPLVLTAVLVSLALDRRQVPDA